MKTVKSLIVNLLIPLLVISSFVYIFLRQSPLSPDEREKVDSERYYSVGRGSDFWRQ